MLEAHEAGPRKPPLQRRACGPIAHDELRAGQVQAQEVLDALLHRDPSDVQPDRPRQVEKRLVARPEQPHVHAPAPHREVAEAVRLELPSNGRRGDEGPAGRAVEPAQEGVARRERHRKARSKVFRELGVIGRGELRGVLQAPPTRRHAERSFGGDVDRVGIEGTELTSDAPTREQRQADLRVRGARHAAEAQWRDHLDRDVLGAQPLDGVRERAHDTVRLRVPGVRDQRDLHAATGADCACPSISGSSWSPTITDGCSVQRSRLSWPAWFSTSVVQLSTQSPSLQ